MHTQKQKFTAKQLTHLAMLIAMEVLLSRFLAIPTPVTRISLTFIPLVVAAYLYGGTSAAIVGGVSDVISATIFYGSVHIGMTATEVLRGYILGLILYHSHSLGRIIISTLLTGVLCTVVLNTFWLAQLQGITGGEPLIALATSRILQFIVISIVQSVLMAVILPQLNKTIRRQVAVY